MGKGQVFLKVARQAVSGYKAFAQKTGACSECLPVNVRTFDYVKGFTQAKGNFEIFTFRDEAGKIIQRQHVYSDMQESIISSYKQYVGKTQKGNEIKRVRILHDDCNVEYTTLVNKDSDLFMIREYYAKGDDKCVISALKQGKNKKSVICETKWDGEAPKINYENLGEKELPKENLEYLPIFGFVHGENLGRKAHHCAVIQERKYNLDGMLPDLKIVSDEIMRGKNRLGECNSYNSQISVSDIYQKNPRNILRTIAHEYRHAYDHADMVRVDDIRMEKYYVQEVLGSLKDEIKTSKTKIRMFLKMMVAFVKFARKPQKEFEYLETQLPGVRKFYEGALAKGRIKDKKRIDELKRLFEEEKKYGELCKTKGHDNLEVEQLAIQAGNEEYGKVEKFKEILKNLFS